MKKLSLNFKISIVVGVLVLGCVAISIGGLMKMSAMNDHLVSISERSLKRIIEGHQIKELFTEQVIQGKNVLIARTDAERKKFFGNVEKGDAELIRAISELGSKLIYEESKQELRQFEDNYQKWFTMLTKVNDLANSRNFEDSYKLGMGELRAISNNTEDFMNSLIARNQKFAEESAAVAQSSYQDARFMVIVISLISILCGVSLCVFVLKSIKFSINEVVDRLTSGSFSLSQTAKVIAASSTALSEATTEQASSLVQTATAATELSSIVRRNAESAKRTHVLASNSTESANTGKEVVGDMIKAIADISNANTNIMNEIEESNRKITDIVKVIAEIGDKTKVINDIVFQTKLLSFNASVEAARAGENGQGFAVVADEVGNLARMSGAAAEEISSLLDSSLQKVEGIVIDTKERVAVLVKEGKVKIETGTKIAFRCEEVLDQIVKNVSQVTGMAEEISSACSEQSHGVDEINKAISELDKVTQINAGSSEESSKTAEDLSAQAEVMLNSVEMLVLEVHGKLDKHLMSMDSNVLPLRKSGISKRAS